MTPEDLRAATLDTAWDIGTSPITDAAGQQALAEVAAPLDFADLINGLAECRDGVELYRDMLCDHAHDPELATCAEHLARAAGILIGVEARLQAHATRTGASLRGMVGDRVRALLAVRPDGWPDTPPPGPTPRDAGQTGSSLRGVTQ